MMTIRVGEPNCLILTVSRVEIYRQYHIGGWGLQVIARRPVAHQPTSYRDCDAVIFPPSSKMAHDFHLYRTYPHQNLLAAQITHLIQRPASQHDHRLLSIIVIQLFQGISRMTGLLRAWAISGQHYRHSAARASTALAWRYIKFVVGDISFIRPSLLFYGAAQFWADSVAFQASGAKLQCSSRAGANCWRPAGAGALTALRWLNIRLLH